MICRKVAGLQEILNGKLKLWKLADSFEAEKMGCRWVRSSSNPSNISGMALIKLIQAIYH